MVENFPKVRRDLTPEVQEAQITTNRINAKKSTGKHIIFKQQKIKDTEKENMLTIRK